MFYKKPGLSSQRNLILLCWNLNAREYKYLRFDDLGFTIELLSD
jgi:hypothetical protein